MEAKNSGPVKLVEKQQQKMLKSIVLQIKPFQPSVAFHIETSHLICSENQMTGFCIKCSTWLKWVHHCIPSLELTIKVRDGF